MENTELHIVKKLSIFEDGFSIEMADHLDLSILIDKQQMLVSVTDPNSFQLIAIEQLSYDILNVQMHQDELVKQIVLNSELIKSTYWKSVNVCFVSNKFTLIPVSLFDENQVEKYYKLNCSFDENEETIETYIHSGLQIVNIFSIEKSIKKLVESHFSNRKIQFLPYSALMIEGFKQVSQTDNTLFVVRQHDLMFVVIYRQNELKFINSFVIKHLNDILYYLLLVAEEFGIAQEKLKVQIWGNTGLETEELIQMKDYIGDVQLGSRNHGILTGFKFSDIPQHQCFDLLSMTLCH